MKNEEKKKRILKFERASIDGEELAGVHELANDKSKENDGLNKMMADVNDLAYELKTEEVDGKFHIYLDGAMSEYSYLGYTANQFRAALGEANGKEVVVNINSPGGEVRTGSEIATMLGRYSAKTTAVGTGDVASAATFVAAAADEFLLDRNAVAHVMFHKPAITFFARGTSDQVRRFSNEIANSLEATQKDMAKIMANKTGKSEEEMNKWMDESRSFSSAEAIEQNFADGYADYRKSKDSVASSDAKEKGLYLVLDDIAETAPAASSEHSKELAAVASLDVPSAESDDLKKVASLALV